MTTIWSELVSKKTDADYPTQTPDTAIFRNRCGDDECYGSPAQIPQAVRD